MLIGLLFYGDDQQLAVLQASVAMCGSAGQVTVATLLASLWTLCIAPEPVCDAAKLMCRACLKLPCPGDSFSRHGLSEGAAGVHDVLACGSMWFHRRAGRTSGGLVRW